MRLIGIIFSLSLLSSCIESFVPDTGESEEVLVVDGSLSNDDVPVLVYLSRSYPYQQNRSNFETGALISLLDEGGNSWNLSEISEGKYILTEELDPVPGKQYKLRIVTGDGEIYESDFQEYLLSNEIDDITYREFRNSTEGSVNGVPGLDIYINAHGDDRGNRYYRWEWTENWEIMSPISYPTLKTCWQSGQSSGININTTENLYVNRLDNQYLFSIPFTTNRLAIRYHVIVKQYSVTRDNYIYLEKLQKINQGSGGFFDPIPAGLSGNIECLSSPGKPVLGFFEASEVVKKDMYIDRDELLFGFVATGFEDCEAIYVSDSIYNSGVIKDYYYVYDYYDSFLNDTIVVMVNQRKCYDCGFIGDPVKPEGWTD